MSFDTKGFLFFCRSVSLFLIAVFFTAQFSNFVFNKTLKQQYLKFDFLDKKISVLQINNPQQLAMVAQAVRIYKLAFVGDIMLDRGVKNKILSNGGGDYDFPFQFVRERLSAYDILVGNLEGPISDKGKDQGSLYSFRMDPLSARALASAGFDIMSLANNHFADWGAEAMADSFDWLNMANVGYVGAAMDDQSAYTSKIKILGNGTKIAFLSFSDIDGSYNKNTGPVIASAENEKIKQSINIANGVADITIVSFHFGDEYNLNPNEVQKRLAHMAIDEGADLVVGHHPHVVQPIEQYDGGYIVYSLGNFVFDQKFSDDTMKGALLEVVIGARSILGVNLLGVHLNDDLQPIFDK